MADTIIIAIDGPSAAGKSTIAKLVAKTLGIEYIDTGAMYRAVAYKMARCKVEATDRDAAQRILADTTIRFHEGRTLLDGEDVSDRIRTPEIARQASLVSALPEVRETLVLLQRAMGEEQSIIMDGRDIGTNVFPTATHKFFLTASVEERAKRRYTELLEQGEEANLADVAAAIAERDHNDSTRTINPLRKAADAVEVDTTSMSPEEVAAELLNVIRGKANEGTDR